MKINNFDEYEATCLNNENSEWIDSRDRIEKFFPLFLKKEYFKNIIIINSQYLKVLKHLFKNDEKTMCHIITNEKIEIIRSDLRKACFSHGHLSVLFHIARANDFLKDFFRVCDFSFIGSINLEENQKKLPLEKSEMSLLTSCLSEISVHDNELLLTFSHDADYLYCIT